MIYFRFYRYSRLFLLIVGCFLINSSLLEAQFGWGATVNHELYHRFTNPEDTTGFSRSAGSALLNFGVGPKFWYGGKKFSVSAEATANIGFFGLSLNEYKGLGTASVPILVKFNFDGLSTLDRDGLLGFHFGGGIQYSKTEIFGLTDEYKALGVTRDWFKTFVIQAGYGFGLSGFALSGYLRIGHNPEVKSTVMILGMQYDFNMPMLRKITTPESSL